ncbi:MAG: hypothetical protein ACOXZV_00700 [Bacteroidales bacterium]|jgi:hypothetical protein
MSNIFKDIWTRIKIDYIEYRQHLIDRWSLRRETRNINRAIYRANIRNKEDGRTYYVLRDTRGAYSALNSDEIRLWTSRGMFRKMNYMELLRAAVYIVTCEEAIREQYNQQQLKKEKYE